MATRVSKRFQGFTLVELIVVIAIIAILASVSIIGFTRYIENARLSNDNQLASQMTNIIKYHELSEGEQELDAHDVRTIIEDNNGGTFDFEPQTKGAGFFFIESTKTVIVHKYEDAIEEGIELAQEEARLLSDTPNIDYAIAFGDTPEQIFGTGNILLTETGSVYAETVRDIRKLANSDDLMTDFSEIKGRLGEVFNDYFDLFDPSLGTLYVNNDQWNFLGEDDDIIILNRVVFANGTTNIPSIEKNVYIQGNGTVVIPKTVNTIEKDAFTPFFNTIVIDASNKTNLSVEEGAFSKHHLQASDIAETGLPELDIVLTYTHHEQEPAIYVEGVLTVYVGANPTSLDFDIEGLPRSEITSIQVNRSIMDSQTFYVVKVYTNAGMLGTMKVPVNIVENI